MKENCVVVARVLFRRLIALMRGSYVASNSSCLISWRWLYWSQSQVDMFGFVWWSLRYIPMRIMHLFQDCVPSEPIFVQRPGGTDEDDGIILSTVINLLPDQPIFLVMLDAKTFTEIARAEVRISIATEMCFKNIGILTRAPANILLLLAPQQVLHHLSQNRPRPH